MRLKKVTVNTVISMLLMTVMLLSIAGCSGKGASSEENSGGAVEGFSGKYVKVLGGTVALRSSDGASHETEAETGLHYVEDTATTYSMDGANENAGTAVGYPMVAETDYYSSDIPIYNFNVMDFGAEADGKTDDTAAFQKALARASALNGGTVYAPAGTYRLNGTINIPSNVALRGDFRAPDDDNAPGNGTVLLVYYGRGGDDSSGFISLSSSSAVMNLTIYYPEQKPGEIIEYSPTFQYDNKGSSHPMIRNVWLVNSYYMIDFSNATATGNHYIKNLYGTPLKQGIKVDYCYDTGKIEGVYFSPQYWLKAQEIGISEVFDADDNAAMFEFVKNNSVGLSLYYSDWEYIYNYNVDSLNIGINFPDNANRRANIQMSHSTFYNCITGISLDEISQVGSMISNTTVIASSEADSTAVLSPAKNDSYPVMFNNCLLESKGGSAVVLIGSGLVEFVNCTFNTTADGYYAVDVKSNGSLYIEQGTFLNEKKHVRVGKTAKKSQIIGCTYPNKPDILLEREEGFSVTLDDTPLDIPHQSGLAHQYKASEPTPTTSYVYYLIKYGAKTGTDCTQALKNALADAAKTGGTVYIPGGEYIVSDSITVPSGVEIRGCSSSLASTGGTLLLAKVKQGEDGEALIKLQANSGVSGLAINYPDQKVTATSAVAYPYTIQGLGEGVWVKNVLLQNSYNGIDFSTYRSDNHYIWHVSGTPLNVGISVGNNNSNGWVEFAHFNSSYWRDGQGAEDQQRFIDSGSDYDGLITYQLNNCDAYIFGNNYAEHVLGTTVYGANRGFVLQSSNGGKFNGLIIGHGTDNSDRAIVVSDCDIVEFTNLTLTVIENSPDIVYLDVEKTNSGKVGFYNLLMFGQNESSKRSLTLSGGKVSLQQGYFFQASKNLIGLINGGDVNVSGMLLKTSTTHFQIDSGVTNAKLIGNFATPTNLDINVGDDILNIINNAGDKLKLQSNLFK